MTDYCAECGKKLDSTPRDQCCKGYGYWSKVDPIMGIKLPRNKEFYLYVAVSKWPKGVRAVKPNFQQVETSTGK